MNTDPSEPSAMERLVRLLQTSEANVSIYESQLKVILIAIELLSDSMTSRSNMLVSSNIN